MGNVAEWTEDCYCSGYDGAPVDGSARSEGTCNSRVVRGGNWRYGEWEIRSAARGRDWIGNREETIGFRVALTLDP